MSKSTIKIVRQEDRIKVKKRIFVWEYVLFAAVALAGMLAFAILPTVRSSPLFWVLITAIEICNAAVFILAHLQKIVIDCKKRQISLYHLNRETYRFDQVREITSLWKPSADEGPDENKLVFVLDNGHRVEFDTSDPEHSRELVTLLTDIILTERA